VRYLGAVALVVLIAAAYAPVRYAGFIWDDNQYVTENTTLTEPGGLTRIWLEPGSTPQYYPLVFTSFWLEQRLWGLDPLGYHLVNVGLHALNALLLWSSLSLLGLPGAWYAAALFGLHPVHAESVAWVTERKNVLSAFFYLLALICYLPAGPRARALRAPWYCLALVLFVAALLSKTVTCSLPAVIVLLLWWRQGHVTRQDLLYLAPFFALGLVLALVTVQMERQHVGALGAAWDLSWVERCLSAGRALWFYAGKLLWPAELVFIYPRWHIDAGAPRQYLFPAAALALVVVLWLARGRLGRGPLTALLIFGGTLLPALGFFNVYPMLFSFVADHFQYLASAALLAAAAAAAVLLAGRVRAPLGAALLALPLALLGLLTYRQCHIYVNAQTLWLDTLARNPDAWVAHHNLAAIFFKEGRYGAAAHHAEATLRLYPQQPLALDNVLALSVLLYHQGNLEAALRAVDAGLAAQPAHADAYLLRGQIHEKLGQAAAAEADYRASLLHRPDHAPAQHRLGLVLLELGRAAEAARVLAGAVDRDPGNDTYRHDLAAALARAKQGP
jgi:tetratricopeptide (TPR) repeat protein